MLNKNRIRLLLALTFMIQQAFSSPSSRFLPTRSEQSHHREGQPRLPTTAHGDVTVDVAKNPEEVEVIDENSPTSDTNDVMVEEVDDGIEAMPVATDDDGDGDEASSAVTGEAPVANDGGSKVTIGGKQFHLELDSPKIKEILALLESVEVDEAPEEDHAGSVDLPAVAIDTGSVEADLSGPRLSIGPDGFVKILGGNRLSIGHGGILDLVNGAKASADAAVQAHLAKAFGIHSGIKGAILNQATASPFPITFNTEGLATSLDGPRLSIGGDQLLDIDTGSLEGALGTKTLSVGDDQFILLGGHGGISSSLDGPRLSIGGDGTLSLVTGAKANAVQEAQKIVENNALAKALLEPKVAILDSGVQKNQKYG